MIRRAAVLSTLMIVCVLAAVLVARGERGVPCLECLAGLHCKGLNNQCAEVRCADGTWYCCLGESVLRSRAVTVTYTLCIIPCQSLTGVPGRVAPASRQYSGPENQE